MDGESKGFDRPKRYVNGSIDCLIGNYELLTMNPPYKGSETVILNIKKRGVNELEFLLSNGQSLGIVKMVAGEMNYKDYSDLTDPERVEDFNSLTPEQYQKRLREDKKFKSMSIKNVQLGGCSFEQILYSNDKNIIFSKVVYELNSENLLKFKMIPEGEVEPLVSWSAKKVD